MQSIHKMIMSILLIFILLTVGTVAYSQIEGWSLIDSLYFSTTTLTTIGFGDLHPTHDSSKLFTVFYIISGVALMLIALTSIATYFLEQNYDQSVERLEKDVWRKIRRKKHRL